MAYVSQEMKKSLAPAIKAVLKEFGMNVSGLGQKQAESFSRHQCGRCV